MSYLRITEPLEKGVKVKVPGSQMVKNLPAIQETQVQSLAQEDPLEKGMATHFSILAWKTLWAEEPVSVQSMESQRVKHN